MKKKVVNRTKEVAKPGSTGLASLLGQSGVVSTAFGRWLGFVVMVLAIMKASRGSLGIATAITLVCGVVYKLGVGWSG